MAATIGQLGGMGRAGGMRPNTPQMDAQRLANRANARSMYDQFANADAATQYDMLGRGRNINALRSGFMQATGQGGDAFNAILNRLGGGARPEAGMAGIGVPQSGGSMTPTVATAPTAPTAPTATTAGGGVDWDPSSLDPNASGLVGLLGRIQQQYPHGGGIAAGGGQIDGRQYAGGSPKFNELGGMLGGAGPSGGMPRSSVGGNANVGYGFDVKQYLDPSMRYQMDEAQRVLENSAAARGALNSGQTLRDLTQLGTNMAATDWNNAFGRAANVRDFTAGLDQADRAFDYGARRDDRNFDYMTRIGDRDFDYRRLSDLARMGLGAAGNAQSGDNALTGLLAGLLGNAGQIQGSGTIGQGNSINSTIGSIINMLMSNSMLNNVQR